MNPLLLVGVAVAGGVGAALRFVLDRAVMTRTRGAYPWGITIVNLTGSFLIGVLAGLADAALMSAPWVAVLGVGLLGGYTTFSTVTVETAIALGRRDYRAAALNGGVQLVAAVALAALGLAIGRTP
ncbi:MAG TPA: CrcB family protein [Microbacterium sp.]|uniref:fluoride efflux transporter FluC n=1 Tax=Microbacterium sp. TaxID=51671 RepID=UPI002BC39667|nr:CrcB family protein [Microbacterium sp.]HWI32460.1 CrcB family protein [Microbacterium sp.]